MPISDAKKRANKKWNDANAAKMYDRANILIPKGQKEIYQAHAEQCDESLSSFVNRAIRETIERDKQKTTPS